MNARSAKPASADWLNGVLTDLPTARKRAALKYLETWLGSKWLNGKGNHQLQQLWRRRDWAAAVELLSLATAVKSMKPKMTEKVEANFLRELKESTGNLEGFVFELLAGSMLDHPEHPVALGGVGQRGYDLLLTLKNRKSIRVSCTALLPSIHEREFGEFARSLYATFRQALIPGSPAVLLAILTGHDDPNRYGEQTSEVVVNSYRDWATGKARPEYGFGYSGWAFQFKPLVPLIELPLHESALSHTFIAVGAHPREEQRRFSARVQEKMDNLGKHFPSSDSDVGNVILVKVPNSISITEAVEYLGKMWSPANAHVSAVWVYRAQLVTDAAGQEGTVGHYVHEVHNPHASVPLASLLPPGGQIAFTTEIGRAEPSEPKFGLLVGDDNLSFPKHYDLTRGEHFYLVDARGSEPVTAPLPLIPNIIVHTALKLNDSGQDVAISRRGQQTEDFRLI
jgi:hypothetical protein